MIKTAGTLIGLALLAGCASFSGSNLLPGKSTRAEVEATMGRPAEVLSRPNGDTLLYYSRLPYGREMYVATVGSDGVLRGIEQRLTRQNIAKVASGAQAKEVRELLGPPFRSVYMPVIQRDVWEYQWHDVEEKRILWVQFARDGVVREVLEMHDFEAEPPSGHSEKP
jgi:outer membrane protein assembly factor BamE (lipoprotein component of BamABCDE complex)